MELLFERLLLTRIGNENSSTTALPLTDSRKKSRGESVETKLIELYFAGEVI